MTARKFQGWLVLVALAFSIIALLLTLVDSRAAMVLSGMGMGISVASLAMFIAGRAAGWLR